MLDRNPNKSASQIYVWDPFVRVFHWTLVAGFSIAYLTEEDLLTVHVWAGYVVGALVVAPVLWGLIGPKHARFSDFLYDPATTLRYVRDLLGVGHMCLWAHDGYMTHEDTVRCIELMGKEVLPALRDV